IPARRAEPAPALARVRAVGTGRGLCDSSARDLWKTECCDDGASRALSCRSVDEFQAGAKTSFAACGRRYLDWEGGREIEICAEGLPVQRRCNSRIPGPAAWVSPQKRTHAGSDSANASAVAFGSKGH